MDALDIGKHEYIRTMKGWRREKRHPSTGSGRLNFMIQCERLVSKQTELAKNSPSPNIRKI